MRATPVPVTVAREHRIAASPEAVWAVISEPSMQERLDPRCRVEWQQGDAGAVGSEHGVSVRGPGRRVTMRQVVTASRPATDIAWDLWYGERRIGAQAGEIVPDGAGVVLRWTVTQWPGRLLRGVAERRCAKEMPPWLAAVAREAAAR